MNLSQRIKTAEYLDALFHEFTLEEMAHMTCFHHEALEEDIYDMLMDIVGDDTIIDHRLLLARILYLEEGEEYGFAGTDQSDHGNTTGEYGSL